MRSMKRSMRRASSEPGSAGMTSFTSGGRERTWPRHVLTLCRGPCDNGAMPSPGNPMPAPAPAWRRLAAIVYAALAVVAIVMVVGLLAQFATGGALFDAQGHLRAWWYQPLLGIVVGAYFLASWVRGGQTLGMRPWRIRVTDAAGMPVTWRR